MASPTRGASCPRSGPRLLSSLLLLCALLSPSLSTASFHSRSHSSPFLRSTAQGKEVEGTIGEAGTWAQGNEEGGKGSAELSRRQAQSTADPCAGMPWVLSYDNSSYFVQPSALRACLDTLPLEADRLRQDIKSVKLYLQNFYGSLKVGERSPDHKVPSHYDVIEEIKKYLASFTAEKSSPRVYETLFQIVNKLHDGHTSLIYGWNIYHMFAYNLVAVVEGESTLVRVAPKDMHYPSQLESDLFNVDPDFFGAKVLTINGEDAWNYTRTWATNLSGGYLNAGQRLNSAFGARKWSRYSDTGTSYWDFRVGDFSERALPLWPMSQNEEQTNEPVDFFNMTVQLRGGEVRSASVPWLSAIPPGIFDSFNSSSALQDLFWQPLPSQSNVIGKRRTPMMKRQRPRLLKDTRKRFKGLSKASESDSASPFKRATQVSNDTDFWPVFMLDDNQTAVVVITTFNTDEVVIGFAKILSVASDIQKTVFLSETFKAFKTAESSGAKQVIIDLRTNGGGKTSMGSFLVEMLMGTLALGGQTQLMVDNMRADTEFVKKLVEKKYGWYDPSLYLNLNENPFSGDEGDTFFYPLRNKTYGEHGVPGMYSRSFKMAEFVNDRKNAISELYVQNTQQITPVLGKKPFLLLSDGLCFSTCMNFAHTMRKSFGTRLVLVGGEPGKPFQLAGGGVGFVSLSVTSDLYSSWKEDKKVASHRQAPKAFVGPIDVRMQFANGFVPGNASAPSEFTYLGADKWIMYNMSRINDHSLIWTLAAGEFEKM